MNVLDERILVPAPANVVWGVISDFARNPSWQVDYKGISFLTSFHQGQGTRWRYKGTNRRDYVVEITAWYDRIGYEYTYIDGMPFRQNKGRIRLQEIAEGTIVQWTFSYEAGGMLGGLRDATGLKRGIHHTMVESLKKLWLYMKHANLNPGVYEVKSLMQDAPDAEARAQYKPRHPSAISEPRLVIDEPPIAQDDTRPRPAVRVTEEIPAAEPEFLSQVASDEKAAVKEGSTELEPDFLADVRATGETPSVAEKASPAPTEVSREPSPTTKASNAFAFTPDMLVDAQDVDTSKVSVFDVFGVPKPSETQETYPVPVQPQSPEAVETTRRGLRAAMRRQMVKVRRPS